MTGMKHPWRVGGTAPGRARGAHPLQAEAPCLSFPVCEMPVATVARAATAAAE